MKPPSSSSNSGVSSGISSFLTSSTLKIAVTLCPRRRHVGGVVAQVGLGPRGSRRRGRRSSSRSNSSILPSRKLSTGRMRITSSSALARTWSVVLERQVGGDVVAALGRAVERHQPAAARQDPLQRVFHVGVGELAHRPLDRQPLPLRQVELGAAPRCRTRRSAARRRASRPPRSPRSGSLIAERSSSSVDLGDAVHQQFGS